MAMFAEATRVREGQADLRLWINLEQVRYIVPFGDRTRVVYGNEGCEAEILEVRETAEELTFHCRSEQLEQVEV